MSEANNRQIGGSHYSGSLQHWDFVAMVHMPYFPAQVTRYVARWRKKNGIEDLEKALHYMDKFIEDQTGERENTIKITGLFMNLHNLQEHERTVFTELVEYQLGNIKCLLAARQAIAGLLAIVDGK